MRVGLVWRLLAAAAVLGEGRGGYMVWEASGETRARGGVQKGRGSGCESGGAIMDGAAETGEK